MRKAVSRLDFNKYGCVECGCEYCYADHMSGPSTPVICGECKAEFVILVDGMTVSNMGFGTGKKGDNGKEIYEYPVLSEHPRKGIEKHKYVKPDVRPANGIGEFATPRGVGYDVACFVKSKEAGARIVAMFEKVSKEYENNGKGLGFNCRLDYRPNEPNWIQVKINYPNEERAEILCALLRNNANVITEDIIKAASDIKLSAVDMYKLFGVNSLLVNYDIMHKMIMLVNNYGSNTYETKKVEELYSSNYNLLAQFEMFGTGLQVHNAVYGNDLQTGLESLLNFIAKYDDEYTCQMRVKGTGEEKNKWEVHSNQEIKDFTNAAIEVCNAYFENNKIKEINFSADAVPDTFEQIDIPMDRDARYEFKREFLIELEPLILDYIDWSFIKKVLNGIDAIWSKNDIVTKDSQIEMAELINTSKNKNFIAMFSLTGLLYQVHGEFDREYSLENNVHFIDAILATSHTLSQLESPIVSKIENEKNNEERNNVYEQIKTKLQEISTKYGATITGEVTNQIRKIL